LFSREENKGFFMSAVAHRSPAARPSRNGRTRQHPVCATILLSIGLGLSAAAGQTGSDQPGDSTGFYQMERTIVTAARRPQPAQWVSDDYRVASFDAQATAGLSDIGELLARSSSAIVNDYGGGSLRHVNLRGAGTERTLVLVDGVAAGLTDRDLGDISPEIVDRVEIIEGGQSSLYGMDAVGGIVNIITRQPRVGMLSGNFDLTASSFEARTSGRAVNGTRLKGSLGSRIGNLEWLGGAYWLSSDGAYEYEDPSGTTQLRQNNGSTGRGVFQKLRYHLPRGGLGLLGRYEYRRIDNPGTIDFPSPRAGTSKKVAGVTLDGDWSVNPAWTARMKLSYALDRMHYRDPDAWVPTDSRHRRHDGQLELLNEFTVAGQLVNAGVQAGRDWIVSNVIGDHHTYQAAAFANAVLQQHLGAFVIQESPALRLDYSSIFEFTANGKVGLRLTWQGPLSPSLLANIGSATRAPQFNDLYWPDDFFSIGNPELSPEQSVSGDVGLELRHASPVLALTGRITYFDTRLSDMIMWQPLADNPSKWTPTNIAEAHLSGGKVNLEASLRNHLTAATEYTLLAARDLSQATEKVLIYRPRHVVGGSLTWQDGRWMLGVCSRHSSKVYTDAANATTLPGYTTFDTNAGLRLFRGSNSSREAWLTYNGLNLTDRHYATNQGYPLPGREHRLNLSLQF
jgi:vitamin B12 transporter